MPPLIYECRCNQGKPFIQAGVPDQHVHTALKVVELLTAERKARGISQESLAVKAGVSPSCIQHLEHARATPTLVTLLKLSEALEMSLGKLILSVQAKK